MKNIYICFNNKCMQTSLNRNLIKYPLGFNMKFVFEKNIKNNPK